MNVRELIDKLKEMPQDSLVVVTGSIVADYETAPEPRAMLMREAKKRGQYWEDEEGDIQGVVIGLL